MALREWRGPQVRAKAVAAAAEGIDAVMALCVREAKARVPVRTGTLQGSIELRPARLIGEAVVGFWGSFIVLYALFVEMGTGRMHARPYLRPAADANYPQLARKIQEAFERR